MSGLNENYNLRPLWNAILDIYEEIRKVCDANGIRYYVTGGTALGAARHGGFIPWDDDFDIIMPRKDYRRFIDDVSKQLPAYLRTTDFHNEDCGYRFKEMFGKVYDERVDIVARVEKSSNLALGQGLFVDIIPIDGIPKSDFGFWVWQISRSLWRRTISYLHLPRCSLLLFEKWLSLFDFDKSKVAWDYNGNRRMLKSRTMNPHTDFGSPYWMKFDKTMVPLPHSWKKFLETIFRDWRKLPPKDKRKPSHTILKMCNELNTGNT